MKVVSILSILLAVVCHPVVGQREKLQSGDSIRVALERKIISNELIQLRDSMQSSLISFEVKIKKATPLKAMQLTTAHKELLGYQDKVKIDIQEVFQTSQSGWGAESVERLRATMTSTRREHKRICMILQS